MNKQYKVFAKKFENRVIISSFKEYKENNEGAVPQSIIVFYVIINWSRMWKVEEKKFREEQLDFMLGNVDMRIECPHYYREKPPEKPKIVSVLLKLEEFNKAISNQEPRCKRWRILL